MSLCQPVFQHLHGDGGRESNRENHKKANTTHAESLNFNMNHISQYGLLGFFILVLGLGIGIGIRLIVVGWNLYRKFAAPVPSVVPSVGVRQMRNLSINDGWLTEKP